MDNSEAAKPIAPPSPSHSEESLEFSYLDRYLDIDELLSIEPDTPLHHMSPSLDYNLDPMTSNINSHLPQSAPIIREGFNQNRRKPEGTGCKNCKCKKANCLKLYCKCFASSEYCTGSCSCQNCYNRPTHEDKVIAARMACQTRNHLAFAPKVNRTADSLSENGVGPNKTPASTVHIRGCNCKKSKCENNYCECHENGVRCSIKCRCTGCNNPYGTDSCYSELGLETGTQISESCETFMAENVSHPNSIASSPTPAASSNASLDGSLKRERLSNFYIPDAFEFNASQRVHENSNIPHHLWNVEYYSRRSLELQMPNNQQVCDASSPTPSWAVSSNASLDGSSRRERLSNFDISDAFEFNASQRLNESNNIPHNRWNVENNFRSNPELQMPYIQKVGDASSPTPLWAARFAISSSNASLPGSSRREQPSNFNIPDASEFNASQRLNESSNIHHNQWNVEDNFRSNPELQMPYIQQVGDGSSTTYINPCFIYMDNSSNSAREMIHYHSSSPFPSPTSLQHPTPTPDANPTTPGNSSQHQK